ncbi:MAG: hypothetical protein KJO91_07560, partial [Gammaproteobacteria bacterium]|nr:hypothetical protein [Gammaproteobacteria bacterium]
IQMTQGMLLGSAILMAVPSVMIFMSLILNAKSTRLINILAGLVYLCVLGGTFFRGRNPAYYLFYAAVKVWLLVLIVWFAWKWPKKDA